MAELEFLTIQGRVLACIADDPKLRLRDIALRLDITERSAFGVVKDLIAAGYITKVKDGRNNRYEVVGRPVAKHLQQIAKVTASEKHEIAAGRF
jgi:DNA-binding MarR family transcriptional regulator